MKLKIFCILVLFICNTFSSSETGSKFETKNTLSSNEKRNKTKKTKRITNSVKRTHKKTKEINFGTFRVTESSMKKLKRLFKQKRWGGRGRNQNYGGEGGRMGGSNNIMSGQSCPGGYHLDPKFLYTMCYVFKDPSSNLVIGLWNGEVNNSLCCLKDNMDWRAVTCEEDKSVPYNPNPDSCQFAFLDKGTGQYLFKRCYKVLNNMCCKKRGCREDDTSVDWSFGNVSIEVAKQSSSWSQTSETSVMSSSSTSSSNISSTSSTSSHSEFSSTSSTNSNYNYQSESEASGYSSRRRSGRSRSSGFSFGFSAGISYGKKKNKKVVKK